MKGNCAVIGNTLSLKGISYYCTELDMRLPPIEFGGKRAVYFHLVFI